LFVSLALISLWYKVLFNLITTQTLPPSNPPTTNIKNTTLKKCENMDGWMDVVHTVYSLVCVLLLVRESESSLVKIFPKTDSLKLSINGKKASPTHPTHIA
jgi:hypothetical protein